MANTGFYHSSADYDQFEALYLYFLGAFATAPTVDNNGDALRVGSIYYDTTTLSLYAYNGTTWDAIGGSLGAVTSVFARAGSVVAVAGDYTASQITNTPAGNIAATTVQAALNELDTEKAATSHTHAIADVTSLQASLDAKAAAGANTDLTSVYLSNTGLKVKDTNASHGLSFVPGSDLTLDRTLTFVTGDVNRTVTLSGDTTLSGTNTGDQTITLTGDVTGSGTGSFAATIANSAVTLAKMADMATASFLGRNTAATGVPEVLSVATAKTMLGLTGTNSGDQTITLTGDVTGSGTGSFAATIAADSVTLAKMANIATASFLGRVTAATGDPEVLTGTQATTLLDTFTSLLKGLVPASGGGTANFLRADGSWAAPAGGGGGDMLAANNLSDLTAKYTGKDNITLHGADIASAATVNLETATGDLVDVTGVTTITAITLSEGHERTVRFTGALTLTHGASLVLPGAANITTAAGDFAVFRGYATGVVRCVNYTRAASAPASGTNTGDQTITLTGDVTGSGAGSFAATIANNAVTYAKMQDVSATDKLLGRVTAGAGDVEEIACTAAGRALLDDANAAAQRTTLGAAASGANTDITSVYLDNNGLKIKDSNATHGLIIAPGSDLTVDRTLHFTTGDADRTVTINGNTTLTGTNTGDQTITLTGDVTGSGTGSFAATIANDAVTFAKMQNIATATFLGRNTAATGDVEELSVATAKSLLNLTGTNSGDQTITLTGDVTGSGTGSFAATIANSAVTLAKMADMATASFIGRNTAATGVPEVLSATTATAILNAMVGDSGSGGTKGLVPAPAAGDAAAGKFLKGDGTWATPSAGGVSDGDKGDITVSASGATWTIDADVVTYAKMQNVSVTDRLLGRDTAAAGDVEELTVGGGIEFTGAGGIQTSAFTGDATKSAGGTALTIANDAVTYAKMQNVSATDKVLGRSTAGAGDVEEIACTAAGRAILDDADAAAQRTTLGVAYGKQSVWVPAGAMVSRTTAGAADGTLEMTTNDNMFRTKDFDTATQEFVQFDVRFPKSWDESTITFVPYWSHPSTTTNFGVVWSMAGIALSDGDAGDVAFGTEQTSTDTGGTTNDIFVGPESSAITIGGTPAEGDVVMLRVARNVANGSDNMAVDARLHGVLVLYTNNNTNDT
jgi:hypothetical protein